MKNIVTQTVIFVFLLSGMITGMPIAVSATPLHIRIAVNKSPAVYQIGEQMVVTVETNQACYLTLLSLWTTGGVKRVMTPYLPGGGRYTFDQIFIEKKPAGRQTVYGLCTRAQQTHFKEWYHSSGELKRELDQRLRVLPQDSWADDNAQFEIVAASPSPPVPFGGERILPTPIRPSTEPGHFAPVRPSTRKTSLLNLSADTKNQIIKSINEFLEEPENKELHEWFMTDLFRSFSEEEACRSYKRSFWALLNILYVKHDCTQYGIYDEKLETYQKYFNNGLTITEIVKDLLLLAKGAKILKWIKGLL